MEQYLARVVARTLADLRRLDEFGLDLKHRAARREGEDRFVVPGILSASQVERVRAADFDVEVVENLSGVAEERLREVPAGNRFEGARSTSDLAERTILGYLTVDEIEAALTNLQALNPGLVTLIPLPNLTWEGRRSHAVRVRAGTRAARPGVLFTGAVHAREWGGSDICVSFVTRIVDAYRGNTALSFGGKTYSAPQVRSILENVDLFVFPDVNPDGKHFSQTTNPGTGSQSVWWRKNRNPNAGTGSTAAGVDVNRNFDFLWSSGIGTSTTPSSGVYRGAAAFSEPEARNVRHLFDSYPSIRYYVDIHSFGELILYSWGDDDNQSTDPAQNFRNPAFNGVRGTPGDTAYREFISTLDGNTAVNLARRMGGALSAVRGRSYTVQQAVGLYPTSATTDDYAFSRHLADPARPKVYGYTIEFGTEFVPPWAEMQNVVADVGAALCEFCLAAGSDVYLRDNPADTGAVPSAGAFWNSPDVWVRNRDDGGTAHQDTVRGRDNFVYVRVGNRGVAEARDVAVRVYLATFAGTQFVHPGDWIPRNPAGGGSVTTPGTYLIGEARIPSLAPGASRVISLRWSAALVPPALNWHPCLLVEASPDDGPPAAGPQVWENNNLAQKNLTIVNAARGQFLEFPFRVGSRYGAGRPGAVVVRRVRAPGSLPVYLDVKDAALIASLGPRPPGPGPVALPPFALPARPRVRLLRPATVALSAAGAGRGGGGEDDLVLRLPAETRIAFPGGAGSAAAEARGPAALAGLSVEVVNREPLLKVAAAEARLPLALRPRELKPMSLRVAVPANAAPGERYEFQVAQFDDRQRLVGGVSLVVHVAG